MIMDKFESSHLTQAPRLLVFSASLRSGSINTRLARYAVKHLERLGAQVDYAAFREFDAPSYDQDVEDSAGIPAPAREFHRRFTASDGVVIVSPEYNASFPGSLKNALDWLSRFKPNPFAGRYGLLMSASNSLIGGNRGLWSLRIPLEKLGLRVFPDMFSLAQADQAWSADETLRDPALQTMFERMLSDYVALVEAAKNYQRQPQP